MINYPKRPTTNRAEAVLQVLTNSENPEREMESISRDGLREAAAMLKIRNRSAMNAHQLRRALLKYIA